MYLFSDATLPFLCLVIFIYLACTLMCPLVCVRVRTRVLMDMCTEAREQLARFFPLPLRVPGVELTVSLGPFTS